MKRSKRHIINALDKKQNHFLLLCILIIVIIPSCQREDVVHETASSPISFNLPIGFPVFDWPIDNEFSVARAELGRKLFYDPILSVDSTKSCSSCHDSHKAFSDSIALSVGVQGRLGTRNAPSLANVAYQPYLLREGGVPTLEMQVGVPIQEHNEFDFNIVKIAERLQRSSLYTEMSLKAYNRTPDAFVITRALGNFQRLLLSGNSRYDQFTFQGKTEVLNASEKRGIELFNSERLGCQSCHSGFLFTNFGFANNGLYEEYADIGRMRLTDLSSDNALFKIPSLRNIEITGPYMFDGSLSTLEEVIAHYQSGGKKHPNKSLLLKPFSLTDQERTDLIAFLKSLTDHEFIQNKDFQNEK